MGLGLIIIMGWAHAAYSRVSLILSLEEVIGRPPDKPENQFSKAPELFYVLRPPEPDPEMMEIIRKQRSGFTLTADEQELLDIHYQQGGIGGSGSPLRKIAPEALFWNQVRVKVPDGPRLPFITCNPKANGPFPIAIILDPEIEAQMEAGKEEYARIIRNIPIERELPYDDAYRGRYITNNPLGNLLLSHGVAIVIPVDETLETLDSISAKNWEAIVSHFTSPKRIDEKSVFLVSTKEFADTTIKVGSTIPFNGIILEEPETGLFGNTLPSTDEDSAKMAGLLKSYTEALKDFSSPMLFLRQKQNPVLRMNETLLLVPFLEDNRKIKLSITDFPIRIWQSALDANEDENKDPQNNPAQFAYFRSTLETLKNRILFFIQSEGVSPLRLLPEESTRIGSSSRAQGLINSLGNIGGLGDSEGGFEEDSSTDRFEESPE